MNKWKIFAFLGMGLFSLSAFLLINLTKAQSTVPFQCGKISSITSSNQSPNAVTYVYVSSGTTRIGKINPNTDGSGGSLAHDSYTMNPDGTPKSVAPAQTLMISSGNAVSSTWDFWVTCVDGRQVHVHAPSRGSGQYWWLYIASDGSTYNGGSGNTPSIAESTAFTSTNLARANNRTGLTPQPPPPDIAPPTISAVTVTNITQTAATIIWTTNENADSQVDYGITANYGTLTTLAPALVTNHTVNLTGLTAGTAYNYRVKSKDASGNLATNASTFTTQAAVNYSFNWTLHRAAGSIETRAANRAKSIFKLENIGNTDVVYTVACVTSPPLAGSSIQLVNQDGTYLAPFSNDRTLVPMNSSKYLEYSFDVGTLNPGTFQATCRVNRDGGTSVEEKMAGDTVTLIAPVVTVPPPPPPGTTTPWVEHIWTFSDGTDKSFILKRIDKEYLVFIASVDSACKLIPKSKFAWKSGAGDDSATNWKNFGIPDCSGTGISPPPIQPKACQVGEKCEAQSWCQSGQKCFYPDRQITCVAWPSGTFSTSVAPMPPQQVSCPAGTSLCDPTDTKCVAPGQVVPYEIGKWCAQGSQYYSIDGRQMACVGHGGNPPAGFTSCRPGDSNCIPEESYGPSTGWCSRGMKCYQKTADTNPQNDLYCTANPPMGSMDSSSCPAGYSYCSPTDRNCKQKNDTWTEANTSYYCMNSQKCTFATAGGTCIGWNESCPAGTKYCSATDRFCIEPNEYKTLTAADAANYWCGGGNGMVFYSANQGYCESKKKSATAGSMMLTSEEVKAVFTKLGTGWGLCRPGNTNCIEPGKTGPNTGWCAWYPPNNNPYPIMSPLPLLPGGVKTCPALDGTVSPPPLPPVCGQAITPAYNPMTKECKEFSNTCIPQGWVKVDQCGKKEEPICLQVLTEAYNPKTGECKTFDNSCIPEGWIKSICGKPPMPPPEMRECQPGEVPTYQNNCRMPMYRFNLIEKSWEKCNLDQLPQYVNIKANPKATYTNCESIHLEIEKEWRTERFLVRDPREYGEWYMPPWDAASKMLQYNHKTDKFELCQVASMYGNIAAPYPGPGEYMASCTPVPEKDHDWLLKKFRAEYQLFKLYRDRQPPSPVPVPLPGPIPLPIPEIPPGQCKSYLNGIRQSLNVDKQFLKDMRRQFSQAKKDYAHREKIAEFFTAALEIVGEVEQLIKSGKCASEGIAILQAKLQKLHSEIFPDLSNYLSEIQERMQYEQCHAQLKDRLESLQQILKNSEVSSIKSKAEQLMKEIEKKLKDFDEQAKKSIYYLVYECQDFTSEIESKVAPLLRLTDKKLNQIIEEIIRDKLEPVRAFIEERGKKLDELLVRVAQLHTAIDKVSEAATQISERITVSYTALARIAERFAAEKTQIQAAKDRLIPLVEEAMKIMEAVDCVPGRNREQLAQEFGNIATVNWIGEKKDELGRRLERFIISCRNHDVVSADITALTNTIDQAETQNLEDSYKRGLTPFHDVPTHEWYYGAMVTSYDKGYVTQGRPAEDVLRQDALLMILRASGMGDTELQGNCNLPKSSTITSVSPYAICAVKRAQEKGIALRGNMTTTVSRAEVASWIGKVNSLPKEPTFETLKSYTDLKGLDASMLSSIGRLVANEVMVGIVSGEKATFQPQSPLTRSALVVVLEKLLVLRGELH